jgi:hypothetical protein
VKLFSTRRKSFGTRDATSGDMRKGAISRERSNATVSREKRTLISRLAPLLNRPLLIGIAAVLASLFCGDVAARAVPLSEVKTEPRASYVAVPSHVRASKNEEMSPLFLAVFGLAALALSQTRGSQEAQPKLNDSRAGKNVAPGQKLPKTPRHLPELEPLDLSSGVIAREHHDDVVGFEAVSGVGMLHE